MPRAADDVLRGARRRAVRAAAWCARLRPETLLLAVFLAVLAVLEALYGGRFNADKLTAKVPLAAVALLWLTAGANGRWRRARVLADWGPAILCIVVYENLHDVVKLVHPGTLDAALARLDLALFGVQPTLWLQPLSRPWLTDLLTVAYGSYFFTPTILGAILYAQGRLREFRTFMLLVVATMYLGFLGYVLVPAVGPLHYLHAQYTNPVHLQGLWLHRAAERLMNDWRSINRDCFPSLHTAVSTVTLVFAWRVRHLVTPGRLLVAVYLPLTACLWFSTVYLRYHWVVDLLAGWLLAGLVLAVAPRWSAWHERYVEPVER